MFTWFCMVWCNFNFLGFLQQTCRWQMQNMLLEKIQSFNSFLNGVWECKWVEWCCMFLEEGLFTVWIHVGSLTYFVSKSVSMKTEMYSFSPLSAGREVGGKLCTNTKDLWTLYFYVYYIRLSTEYRCFLDKLLEHLLLLARRRPSRRSIPFAIAAKLCVLHRNVCSIFSWIKAFIF